MSQKEKSILGSLFLISFLAILLGFLSTQSFSPSKPFMPGVVVPEKVAPQTPAVVVPVEALAPETPDAPAVPAETEEVWQ